MRPEELVFSKEYQSSDHRIEELVEEGDLDADDLRRLHIEFVSSEYLHEGDIWGWSCPDFVDSLGGAYQVRA